MPDHVARQATALLGRSLPFPVPRSPYKGGTGDGTTGSEREQRGSSSCPPAAAITGLRFWITTAREVLL